MWGCRQREDRSFPFSSTSKILHGRIFGAGISLESKLFSVFSLFCFYNSPSHLPSTLRFSVESREGKPWRKDCWLLAEAGSALNVYICWRKEGRLFRFACSLRVWTIFAFTFVCQYSKTLHRGFKLDPHAVYYPSADQSALALRGKIVFFATLLGSVFKLIQGTYSPTFLEALVLGLEYFW